MKPILLHPIALISINQHLESTYPNEGCGFLYGAENEENREIKSILPIHNSKEGDQRRRFSISADDYQKGERYAEVKGHELLGIYHSHPDHPATPSIHDLKQAIPFFSYFITSVEKGKAQNTTSWQLDDNYEFEEEKITILVPETV